VEALLDRYQTASLLGVPIVLLGSIAIGWLLSNVALRPVRAMQRSARRISATNLSERLPVPAGRDEIADLARLLNDLFARLEASFDQVRRFTADASHELKTPLSLIRLHAERLAQSPHLDESRRADIESQIEEIGRLNKLVESLLLLAQADAGSLRLDARREDPAAFVRETGEDALALAEDKGLAFEIRENQPGEVVFDRVMLRQVLLNLLSNALRHSPPDGRITIGSSIVDEQWRLVLEDEGPGLPSDQLESIFGRFVRGHGTGTRQAEGSGLGLAIARSIVEAHRGAIRAENIPKGGLRIIVDLPGATALPVAHTAR
jgi:two-component system heavy metal sensor histidine kinase CusS